VGGDNVKYEVRMTISFVFNEGRRVQSGYDRIKTTLIEYIDADGIADAFNKAAEYKHEVAIKISKGESKLFAKKAWGSKSDRIQISLDAVVAKPKLEEPKAIYHNMIDTVVLEKKYIEKLYNDLVDIQAKIKAITGNMTGDHNINWWLAILQKLLRKQNKQ